MADTESKEIQAKQKQEVTGTAEQTRPGLVFTPDVDIFETENEITLLADIPGVEPEDMVIDLRDNVITLSAEAKTSSSKDERPVITEYGTGTYHRQFTLSDAIDQEKIDAKLTDGVLRLTLPKVSKLSPRRISVTAG